MISRRRPYETIAERGVEILIYLCGISAIIFVFGIFFFVFREASAPVQGGHDLQPDEVLFEH